MKCREAAKQRNLSRSFVDMGKQLRQELDQAGGRDKVLVLAGDGRPHVPQVGWRLSEEYPAVGR